MIWFSGVVGGGRLIFVFEPSFFRWAYSIPTVRRPYVFQTWIPLKPVGQSWSNLMCSITEVGERLHKVLGQIGSKLVSVATESPQWLTYDGEKDASIFSRLLLIRSFLYLQVTRACIKSRMNSNFGHIRPLTTELAALERLKNFP